MRWKTSWCVRKSVSPPAEAQESPPGQTESPLPSFSTTPKRYQQTQARLLRKWELSQQVQALHRQGVSLIKIAAQLGLARNTVRTYVRQPPDPTAPKPRPLRASQLDPYEAHLLKRWREGCRNAALLHREISEMGYPGAQTMVRAYLAYLCKHPEQANHDHPRKERAAVSPRALRWLLTRSPEDLTQEEQAKRARLLAVSEEVRRVHALLQAFQEMVRQR